MTRRLMYILLVCFSGLGLAQCGGKKSLSNKIDATFLPEVPIVVNADITLNAGSDNEVTIKAPWFLFQSGVKNNSESPLTLVTYTFNIIGYKNGGPNRINVSINPSVTCDLEGYSRPYLAIIPTGVEFRKLDGVIPFSAGPPVVLESQFCDPTDITPVVSTTPYEGWYIGGLPESDTFTYTADVTAEGWFEDSNGVPIERLVLTSQITTQ